MVYISLEVFLGHYSNKTSGAVPQGSLTGAPANFLGCSETSTGYKESIFPFWPRTTHGSAL